MSTAPTQTIPAAPAHLERWRSGRRSWAHIWRLEQCPHCGEQHTHGGGGPGEDPLEFLGHRVAHCADDRVRPNVGYDLVEADPAYTARVLADPRPRVIPPKPRRASSAGQRRKRVAQAQRDGYLLAPSTARRPVARQFLFSPLYRSWAPAVALWQWCVEHQHPYVTVSQRKAYAAVALDPTPVGELPPPLRRALAALLAEFDAPKKRGSWHVSSLSDPVVLVAERVPIAAAEHVASQLVALWRRATEEPGSRSCQD